MKEYTSAILGSIFLAISLLISASYSRFASVKFTQYDLLFLIILVAFFVFLAIIFIKMFFKE